MFFIFSFTLFVLLDTLFVRFNFSVMALFLCFFCLIPISYRQCRHEIDSKKVSKKLRKKYFFIFLGKKTGLLLFSFFVSMLSISFFLSTYSSLFPPVSSVAGSPGPFFSRSGSSATFVSFVGTGVIVERDKPGRYVFMDTKQRHFFLSSNKRYVPGDVLFIAAPVILNTGFDAGYASELVTGESFVFNFPKRAMTKGIYGSFFSPKALPVGQQPLGFFGRVRQKLTDSILALYGETHIAGLYLGLLVGDKSYIPLEDYKTFTNANIVHIIAVSGGNIMMLVVFLSFLFGRVPFYFRQVLLFASVVAYALVCGADASVVRATVMGCLSLIALFFGRQISVRRSLAYAWVGMLLRNPFLLVYDVGFLLSFAAIIGIVWMQTLRPMGTSLVREEKKGTREGFTSPSAPLFVGEGIKTLFQWRKSFLSSYVLPTLGASVGVLPLILFFMGTTNLTGLVANMLVLPLIPLLMVYGFVSSLAVSLLGTLLSSSVIFYIQKIGIGLASYVYTMGEIGERVGVYITVNVFWFKLCVLIAGIVFVGRFIRRENKT